LNVGGNSKAILLPPIFDGYEHLLLDIDPKGSPDLLCDARELLTTPAARYDAVYCSHNLEHYYRHDVKKVLAGFVHVLKPHGFAHIRVPDIMDVIKIALARNLELDDVLYQSPTGPIQVLDVLYGYGLQIERSGVDFFAHTPALAVRLTLISRASTPPRKNRRSRAGAATGANTSRLHRTAPQRWAL
jgi:SAM-dependent methyltransferase